MHWVIHNIPADVRGPPEGAARLGMPPGAMLGLNDWKRAGNGGPCPPIGRHSYFHKLYALPCLLLFPGLYRRNASRDERSSVAGCYPKSVQCCNPGDLIFNGPSGRTASSRIARISDLKRSNALGRPETDKLKFDDAGVTPA